MSTPVKIGSLVLLAFAVGTTVYFYGIREARESLTAWFFVVVAIVPFVLLALAACWSICKNLDYVVLLVSAIFFVLAPLGGAFAVGVERTFPDDESPLLALVFVIPVELCLALWVFGAVLLDRKRNGPRPGH
jgi:hypothetical protein